MPTEQEPVKLDIVTCKSSLDLHIVKLRVSLSEAVRAQLSASRVPFQLIWQDETSDFEMSPQEIFEGTMDFRIPVPEVGTLKARFTLPNGTLVEAAESIPPVEEYRTDFADRVAHGDPIQDGDHFRIPEGVYALEKDLIVKKGAILQADPGVRLFFGPGVGIYSEGTLLFQGSGDKPIYLTATDADKKWRGMALSGPYAAFSAFSYCGMEYGEGTPVIHKDGHLYVDREKGIKRGGGLLIMNMANEAQAVRLEGVTFRNGQADQGGGLSVYNSTVALADTHFVENRAARSGGGLHVENGIIRIMSSVGFAKNHADVTGGAIAATFGTSFEREVPSFEGNTAGRLGQDVYVAASDVDTASWKADVLDLKSKL